MESLCRQKGRPAAYLTKMIIYLCMISIGFSFATIYSGLCSAARSLGGGIRLFILINTLHEYLEDETHFDIHICKTTPVT